MASRAAPAAPLRWMGFRSRRSAALTAVVALDIGWLVACHLGAIGGLPEFAGQVLLIAAFAALAVVDFRIAVAIAVLELIVAGASGHWTVLPGRLYGRLVLDGIVFGVALARLARQWRDAGMRRRPELGRYGLHGVLLAVLLPGIWIPLGLLNGISLHDAFADGNGYHFLAFALVLPVLAMEGDLHWLRRWVLVGCLVTAVLTIGVALAALSGAVPIQTLSDILMGSLDMGGFVGYQEGLRVYLGSGLYLQVGVVLVLWELMQKPGRLWPWLSLIVLGAALLATYTRGYWLGAGLGALLVIGVGMDSLRRAAALAAAATVLFVAVSVAGYAVGFSLPGYVVDRLASVFSLDTPGVGHDEGTSSNSVKVVQARILVAHIAERPVVGWGFGTVAPDYPFGQSYSYELEYLALAYKTGLVGLALFLSFPLRLLIDSIRARLQRLPMPPGMGRREAAVPIAILSSVLVVGATNPYLAAAFGLATVVLSIAWLDPFAARPRPGATESAGT